MSSQFLAEVIMKFSRNTLTFLFLGGDRAFSHLTNVFTLFHKGTIAVQTCDGTDTCRQFAAVGGLAEKIIGPRFNASEEGGTIIQGGKKDDRYLSELRCGSDAAADFIAIHAWHH